MEENFNKHLGGKLKMRRLALGLTQTKVAKAINVTFQQIQKYFWLFDKRWKDKRGTFKY